MIGIVATVGPSLNTEKAISAVIAAGATGFRIPLARQRGDRAVELGESIRAVAQDRGVPISVYLDVPGPKKFLILDAPVDHAQQASIEASFVSPDLAPAQANGQLLAADRPREYFVPGDRVIVGDGEAELTVDHLGERTISLTVASGRIGPGRHGIAVPGKEGHRAQGDVGITAQLPVISALPWAAVMPSFIESASQLTAVRAALGRAGGEVWAKVETRAGADACESIATASDGVLLGRGDLLIDAGMESYYAAEQKILRASLASGKPLMVGTQLWTSSSTSALPHRSELSYICHLVERGVASLMLSDETTVGADPAKSIADIRELIQSCGER